MSTASNVATSALACETPLILVVEDEFLVRCVAADALCDAGYRVIEADSGDEARDMLIAGVPIDLVFSDVRMPGLINGLDLLSWAQTNFPAIKVILCSGHLSPTDALAYGAKAFVAKPYRMEDVSRRIEECLKLEVADAS